MAIGKMCHMAALCSFIILTTFVSSPQSASCCLRYIRRPLPCKRLLNYDIQTINTFCDLNAIIFHVPGRFVCANPSDSWARRGKQCLDERRRKSSQIIKEETRVNATAA